LDKNRINELVLDYAEKLALYGEYSLRIRNLIGDLVRQDGIQTCGIETRTKNPSEIANFLNADDGANGSGIQEILTVRVTLRFPEDIQKMKEMIFSEFNPDFVQADTGQAGIPEETNALSLLTLSESRASLREWRKYKGLGFSLELRTVLQEAAAAISMRINKNDDSGAGIELRGKMARLVALLEDANENFPLMPEPEEAEDNPVPPPPQNEPEVEPDVPAKPEGEAEAGYSDDELYVFFNEDVKLLSKWNSTAIKAGFSIFVPSPNYLRESFQYLCKILRAADVCTIPEVREFLEEMAQEDRAVTLLKTTRSAFGKDSAAWRVDAFSAMFLLVLDVKWEALKDKDLDELGIKKGSARISGMEN